MKKIAFAAVLMASNFLCVCLGENPIIQTHFSPDPAPMVYNGTVYIYTGDDIPGTSFFYMTKWRVSSSTDMVNWTDRGVPLVLESFSWARDRAWASQCIECNGKFYWYICAQTDGNTMGIGVAVSDSPTGPFVDAIGKPLIDGNWVNIDPTVFIDKDGQAYLYWGNPSCNYVKLNKDMISFSGEIVTIPHTLETFGGVRGRNRESNVKNVDSYVEGPWAYERNGKYYLMYAAGGLPEHISYSMSDSPVGPWKYIGQIMPLQETNSFTNHSGVVDYKGKSYFFYHTGKLPNGGGYGRSTAIEEFAYNADGTFPTILMTSEGVSAVGTINPFKRVEAETMAWSKGLKTNQHAKTGVFVTEARIGSYMKVRSVEFGNKSPQTFLASVATGLPASILEVRLDSIKGKLATTLKVDRTGGWDVWKTIQSPVNEQITGVHDLFFLFKGDNVTVGRELFNFDFWMFQ
jgi:arabinoxylan arabinofuranohydrolase